LLIDFLLSREEHQTISEIQAGTLISVNIINGMIENLLDIGAVGIDARKVQHQENKEKTKDENTYYLREDTDTGKSIRDLWYHLMQVQTEQF
jgi:hypothetical protein